MKSEKIIDNYQGFKNINHSVMKMSFNNMDIYSGEETIRFNNRHPIYKTLMKLEFEDILRCFPRK